jgi:ABC-type glutathione transport system ATPase component
MVPKTKKRMNMLSGDQLAISMYNATFYWNQVCEASTKERQKEEGDSSKGFIKALSNVSIDFRLGELTFIIGTAGCGKSALIQALVGKLLVHSGKVKRSMTIWRTGKTFPLPSPTREQDVPQFQALKMPIIKH